MAKEADKRMDLKTRFHSEIETVYNNAKVLSDMLTYYSPDNSSVEEKDLMRELFESCERLRLRLFKLANDLTDDDPNLTTLFDANDELTKVINAYKNQFGSKEDTDSAVKNSHVSRNQISLLDIENSASIVYSNVIHDEELLDDHLLSSNINSSAKNVLDLPELREIFSHNIKPDECPNDVLLPQPARPSTPSRITDDQKNECESSQLSALDELNALSQLMIRSTLCREDKQNWNKHNSKPSLNELQKLASKTPAAKSDNSGVRRDSGDIVMPLTNVNVSLDSIRPSNCKPITLYDKNDLKVILHLASNTPRVDVKVFVLTVINTNHFPVTNIAFLAAVPKVCLLDRCIALSNCCLYFRQCESNFSRCPPHHCPLTTL